MGKKILTVLFALVLAVCMPIAAMANQAEDHAKRQPDYDRLGSIHVTLLTAADRTPVPGGTLELITVALAEVDDGNNILVYTEDFEECGVDLADLEDPSLVKDMAQTLADWAAENALTGVTAEVGEDGTADFGELPLGLYLITQPVTLHAYEPVFPFLVTVPVWDEVNEELVYDVDAEPKCDGIVVMTSCNVPVKKVVTEKNGTAPRDTAFRFQLTPGERDNPMPENPDLPVDSETGAMTLEVKGAGEYDFGDIYFGLKDVGNTYTYKLQEVNGSAANFTYDKTVYVMTVEVTKPEDEIVLIITKTKENGGESDFTFTNTYEEESKDYHRLPQTGLLWWPAPVLMLVGVMLVAFGFYRNRRSDFEG